MKDSKDIKKDIKIKICGMTCEEDIQIVNEVGADLAGFVMFFPKSRRNLSVGRAAELAKGLDGVKSVAVVVSPTAKQIESISDAGFDMIQIHGELSDESYECCDLPILRAFNVSNIGEFERASEMDKVCGYVFDAAEPGSGRSFDWTVLKNIPRDGKMMFLAGGLNKDNVSAAIEIVNPDGVDVSSGVEKKGDGKDRPLCISFVKNARG